MNDDASISRRETEFKKVNQHYVPQFWQRRFKDANGKLWVRYSLSSDPRDPRDPNLGKAFHTSTKDTLTDDFTYTVVDEKYQPYDALENVLSEKESQIRENQDKVLDAQFSMTAEVVATFCWGMAISVCRLPYIMPQAFRRRKEMAWAFAEVHDVEKQGFTQKMAGFGQIVSDEDYEQLKAEPLDSLVAQANYIEHLSPLNPDMPAHDALDAVEIVKQIFCSMDLTILNAGSQSNLIIGDTPVRDSDLAMGFTVPLSKTEAAQFSPSSGVAPQFKRRSIGQADAQALNQEQYNNSATHVIGSDPSYLDSLTS